MTKENELAVNLLKTRPDLSIPKIAAICQKTVYLVRMLGKENGVPDRKPGRIKIR